MVSATAFQAEDVSSILITRSKTIEECILNRTIDGLEK